jgi:spore germination protein
MMEIYVVRPGDTLYRIASKLGVTLAALLQLNASINPNRLVVGQAILIPAPPVQPLRYTIEPGDTLYILAQTFNTTVPTIAQANNISNPHLIQPGAVFTIPGWSQTQYTVRSGDTLYRIGGNFGIAAALLAKINRIAPPALIYPGQVLTIPQPIPAAVKSPLEVTGYFQLVNLTGLEHTLSQTGAYFTFANFFHYPVNGDGTITISANTRRAVEIAQRFKLQPLPVITNRSPATGFDPDLAGAILGNAEIRQKTVASVLNLLDSFGFGGINVDFENMYPEDRRLYTAFISELTQALKPRGYLTTIAVAPKYSDFPTSAWVGTFDYAALGQVADRIFLMTYEWGWSGGPPMAVAPINQVRRVLEYAVSRIPRKKICFGIPLYGYNWALPDTPENWAATINLVNVYDLAYRYGAVIHYDPVAQSPWFEYRDENGIRHEVWFEDARSVRAKYALARELNLNGVGYWCYTNEPYGFSQNWPLLSEFFTVVKSP